MVRDATKEDLEEFRQKGILQEVNRTVLHPLGFALSFEIADSGEVTTKLLKVDDPEGWHFDWNSFDLKEVAAKYYAFDQATREVHRLREASLGFGVQPIGLNPRKK